MANDVKVSICVPIYNVAAYIEECAESLFNQTYNNIEYIFVDDNSPDSSVQILCNVLDRYPQRKDAVRIIRHEENKGLACARITAIKSVTGKYILHVDSDDYLEADAVKLLVESAENNNAQVVIGQNYLVRNKQRVQAPKVNYEDKDVLIHKMLEMSVSPSIWGKLFAADLFSYDLDTMPVEGLNHGEDYATVPRLLYCAKTIAYLDEPVYNYRLINTFSYTSNFTEKSFQNLIKANEKLNHFFKDKYDKEFLDYCTLRLKVRMIKPDTFRFYPRINQLYPDVTRRMERRLALKERILLFLLRHNLFTLTRYYIILGHRIKGTR